MADWIAAGAKWLRENPEWAHKSFMLTGIDTDWNSADDYMIRSETDI